MMPQGTISEESVNYLRRHALLADLCFLALKEGHLTATEAAKKTALSIQSTTNALRALEDELGFLSSRKEGRMRVYTAANPEKLRRMMDSVATSIDTTKYRPGTRLFVPESFKSNVYEQLASKPKLSRFRIEALTPIETSLLNFDIELEFKQQRGKPAIVAINQIYDEASCLMVLGKFLLLSTVENNYSEIVLLNLFIPTLSASIKTWNLEKIMRPLFKHSLKIIEHHVGPDALLDLDFSKKVADQIEESLA